jgi:hypothetical protein
MGALMVPAEQMAGGWELAGMEEVMAVGKVGGGEGGGGGGGRGGGGEGWAGAGGGGRGGLGVG